MAEGYDPDLVYKIDYDENEDYPSEGQTKDEKIEMKPLDGDWGQTEDGFVKPPEDDLPEAPGTIESPATQEKIESFYKYLDDNGFNVNKNAPLEHKARFTKSADNKLGIIYKGETIWLSHIRNTSQFLTPKTIALKYGKGGT